MERAKFLVTIALVVLLLDERRCEEVTSIRNVDYLDLPDLSELHADSSPDKNLQQVVQEVVAEVDMSLPLDEVVLKIGELVAEKRRELSDEEPRSAAWKILEKLTNYKTTPCSSDLIFAARYFLAGIDDDLTYAKLRSLLQHILPEMFLRCAQEISQTPQIYTNFPTQDANDLRTLLREGLDGKGYGPHLLPRLRTIQLPETAGKLDLYAMMMMIVRKYEMDSFGKGVAQEVERVFDKYCANIYQGHFYDNIEIINLANAFGPVFEHNNLLAQLSEFHRICSSWKRDEVHREVLKEWSMKEDELEKVFEKEEDEDASPLPWWKRW